ncbi:MAG TPA: hypothetical protein PLB89_08490 [Flavobacteriales bacterium]|nr:hypothetical protein [Flavobacteriales bacterium]
MNTVQRILCTITVTCALVPVLAQTGLHFVPFSYDTFTKRGTNCMAFGLDRDVNEHSSIAFDVQFGFRLFSGDEVEYQQGNYQGTTVDYAADPSFIGFQYRSSYLFKEADEPTPYLSVLVGVRSTKMVVSDVVLYGLDYNDPIPSWAKESSERIMVFPVGLRFGYRSPLYGYAGDVYFGIAHQIGKDLWTTPFLEDEDQLSGFTFHVGYSFGVGW